MDSIGYKALKKAVAGFHGKDREFAIIGSLPLIGGLKGAGYDVKICGFFRTDAYHAKNEYRIHPLMRQGRGCMRGI
jgi:hypothetical protein